MTLLAPQFIYAALAVAAAVVALHFLASRAPRAGILPTARFVPERPATTTVRAARPSDPLLLLLRVALVLVAGVGLARPVATPTRRAEARVILVDMSRAVSDVAAIRASARSVYREGDAVIVFDSAARLLTGRVADSLGLLTRTPRKGRLSAAIISGIRAASALSSSADSLELVIVSPLAAEERDAATDSIRRLWPGGARLLRVGGAAPLLGPGSAGAVPALESRGAASDPLAIAVARARAGGVASALIVRDAVLAAASAPGMLEGRAIVRWPRESAPLAAVSRSNVDTIGGVIVGGVMVVAPFERRWSFPGDSLRGAQVIARWTDGEPAAVEWARGTWCERSVAISVSPVGDLVVRNEFVAMVEALGSSCSGAGPAVPMSAPEVASLGGGGGRVAGGALQQRSDARSWLAPWLLALAIVLAVVEIFVRTRRRSDDVSVERERVPGVAA